MFPFHATFDHLYQKKTISVKLKNTTQHERCDYESVDEKRLS